MRRTPFTAGQVCPRSQGADGFAWLSDERSRRVGTKPAVCLVAGAMVPDKLRLQPWRTLLGVAQGLARNGHRVVVVSDGPRGPLPGDLPVVRVPSVRAVRGRSGGPLAAAVACTGADVVIWHLGLTSSLYQRWPGPEERPLVGFWTAPLYRPGELRGLGTGLVESGNWIHGLGAAWPRRLLQTGLARAGVDLLVTETATTAARLRSTGLWGGPLATVWPGVGYVWRATGQAVRLNGDRTATRRQLGYRDDDKVIVYFGPPAPWRGLEPLVRAVALARQRMPSIRLLLLCRRRGDELAAGMRRLWRHIGRERLDGAVQVVDGTLTEHELARRVAAADVAALPFQLVPSDAPLSVLEARVLGVPVVTTRLACLPELAGGDDGLLARPGDPHSLCEALLMAAGRHADRLEFPEPDGARVTGELCGWDEVGAKWSALLGRL